MQRRHSGARSSYFFLTATAYLPLTSWVQVGHRLTQSAASKNKFELQTTHGLRFGVCCVDSCMRAFCFGRFLARLGGPASMPQSSKIIENEVRRLPNCIWKRENDGRDALDAVLAPSWYLEREYLLPSWLWRGLFFGTSRFTDPFCEPGGCERGTQNRLVRHYVGKNSEKRCLGGFRENMKFRCKLDAQIGGRGRWQKSSRPMLVALRVLSWL